MMQRNLTLRVYMAVDRYLSNVMLFVLIVAAACSAKESTSKNDDISDDNALDSLPPKKDPAASAIAPSAANASTSKKSKFIVSDSVEGGERARIVRNDRSEQFMVAISLAVDVSRTFHVRELAVGAFYDELFACKRLHKKVDVPCNYQVHFKVTEQRKVIYDRISPDRPSTGEKSRAFKGPSATKCLTALYENAMIEFSTPVPFEQFVLYFNFE